MTKTNKKLTIIQTGSVTAQKKGMKETLIGLGLGKPHSKRELEDTPSVRGMITKVRHLVSIEGELPSNAPKHLVAEKSAKMKKGK